MFYSNFTELQLQEPAMMLAQQLCTPGFDTTCACTFLRRLLLVVADTRPFSAVIYKKYSTKKRKLLLDPGVRLAVCSFVILCRPQGVAIRCQLGASSSSSSIRLHVCIDRHRSISFTFRACRPHAISGH